MSFRDQRLDPRVSFGAIGGTLFRDAIAPVESGNENRMNQGGEHLGAWEISYDARIKVISELLADFFQVIAEGRLHTWPFLDHLDCVCTTAQSHLEMITSNTWQMNKRRTVGAYYKDSRIVLPILSATTVNGGGAYTIDRNTGIITRTGGADPTSFSCGSITAQGVVTVPGFDKLCRFDVPEMRMRIINKKGSGELICGWAGIKIMEVPLESA